MSTRAFNPAEATRTDGPRAARRSPSAMGARQWFASQRTRTERMVGVDIKGLA